MADTERKVRPKEELSIQAATWNGLMDMLRDYNRGAKGGRAVLGGPGSALLESKTQIYVQNFTGSPWEDSFKIVRLSNSILPLNTDTVEQVNRDPIMGGFLPDGKSDPIAINQKPNTLSLSAGILTPAVISGVTICRVSMLDESHT
jgi:hypothetical protein